MIRSGHVLGEKGGCDVRPLFLIFIRCMKYKVWIYV